MDRRGASRAPRGHHAGGPAGRASPRRAGAAARDEARFALRPGGDRGGSHRSRPAAAGNEPLPPGGRDVAAGTLRGLAGEAGRSASGNRKRARARAASRDQARRRSRLERGDLRRAGRARAHRRARLQARRRARGSRARTPGPATCADRGSPPQRWPLVARAPRAAELRRPAARRSRSRATAGASRRGEHQARAHGRGARGARLHRRLHSPGDRGLHGRHVRGRRGTHTASRARGAILPRRDERHRAARSRGASGSQAGAPRGRASSSGFGVAP